MLGGLVLIVPHAKGGVEVVCEPALAEVHQRFNNPLDANAEFSCAAGYAVTLAAGFGIRLEDRTGRLTDGACAALVEVKRNAMKQERAAAGTK